MKLFRAFVILLVLVFCGCKERIIHNLSEEEANRYLARLHSGSIEAEKERLPDTTWAIAVPKGEVVQAIQFLSDSRVLPKRSRVGAEARGLISSRAEERFRFERAMSEQIADTISAIDGILEARVHLNLAPRDPLFGRQISKNHKSSASVLAIVSEGVSVEKEQLQGLVSGAAGIEMEAVSILIQAVGERVEALSPVTANIAEASFPVLPSSNERSALVLFFVGLLLIVVGALLSVRIIKTRFSTKVPKLSLSAGG